MAHIYNNSASSGVNLLVHKMVLKCMFGLQLAKVPVQQVSKM